MIAWGDVVMQDLTLVVLKALLKKALDDEVAVETPSGVLRFVIVAVRYGED